MLNELGNNIREAREANGLSQRGLAEAIGTGDRRYIADLEHGRQNPTATRLVEIANTLGIRPGELIDNLRPD